MTETGSVVSTDGDDSEEDIQNKICTPTELIAIADEVAADLFPKKSESRYKLAYQKFEEWKKDCKASSFSERVLLAYFKYLQQEKKNKPTTMWSIHSMLIKSIMIEHNIDISGYRKLTAFLKKSSVGYEPKKSLVLTPEDTQKFLDEAPDDMFLSHKVILALGLSGGLRRQEIHDLTVDDIQIKGDDIALVEVKYTKTNQKKAFAMTGQLFEIYKKYITMRNLNSTITTKSLMLKYTKSRCTKQVMGINTIGAVPKTVAEFLGLKDPHLYTGHCLRRSAASMLVSSGADMDTLKRFGAWKSTSVAEGYIVDNLNNKRKISDRINNELNPQQKKPRVETITSNELEQHNDLRQSSAEKVTSTDPRNSNRLGYMGKSVVSVTETGVKSLRSSSTSAVLTTLRSGAVESMEIANINTQIELTSNASSHNANTEVNFL